MIGQELFFKRVEKQKRNKLNGSKIYNTKKIVIYGLLKWIVSPWSDLARTTGPPRWIGPIIWTNTRHMLK